MSLSSVANGCCGVPDPLVPEVYPNLKFTLRLYRKQGNIFLMETNDHMHLNSPQECHSSAV